MMVTDTEEEWRAALADFDTELKRFTERLARLDALLRRASRMAARKGGKGEGRSPCLFLLDEVSR